MPEMDHNRTFECDSAAGSDSSNFEMQRVCREMKGALLGTRFKSFEELKSAVSIEYFNNNNAVSDSSIPANARVRVSYCCSGTEIISVLESGVSQGDIYKARFGNIWDRLRLVFNSPYSIINRTDVERIYAMARWRPEWFGEGDVAFYDLAEKSVGNINTVDLAFRHPRDSTEKGFLNTFNHITAQAFITSCFSEEMADFIADVHERYHHPDLITGKFTEAKIKDLEEGPVDNYVDLINNECGQELGKQLKEKYNISRDTHWTPELMANYLNDLQGYYSWAFQIGFMPFRPGDEIVVRFSGKINAAMKMGRWSYRRSG